VRFRVWIRPVEIEADLAEPVTRFQDQVAGLVLEGTGLRPQFVRLCASRRFQPAPSRRSGA